MIAASPLQAAIYTALTVPAMSAGVYDEVPQGTVLTKYIVIGTTVLERPWDFHDSEGSEQFHQVDVWSKATGAKEVQLLLEDIDARLHNQPLTLSSGQLVLLQRDFSTVLREQTTIGEIWRHGVARYRAIISE